MKLVFIIILSISGNILANTQNKGIYIVKFDHQGLVHYNGNIPNLKATSPMVTGQSKMNVKSAESVAYLRYLSDQYQQLKTIIKTSIKRPLGKTLDYYYTHSGMAVYLSPEEAQKISTLNNVISVEKDKVYQLDTDAGPTFLRANRLWDGAASHDGAPNQGEGVIVGVIDTGLNMDHPSFSDVSEDGYDFASANPFGAGTFVGDCDETFICNDKHIGAWDFADDFPPGGQTENDGPEDSAGHGTHTASTAVGNKISEPMGGFDGANGNLSAPFISGVAPHAHLIHYDVCVNGCSGAAVFAAINQAIADQVDVISFSISGGLSPWSSSDSERLFLDAVAAGIMVSASAGNTSATITDPVARVNHKGPWLLSVANSTHSRAVGNKVSIVAPEVVPYNLTNLFSTASNADNFTGDINANILSASDVDINNSEGCDPWVDSNAFLNKIALIIRGTCNFTDKANNATDAGAIATIVYNNVSNIPIAMNMNGETTTPSVMMGLDDANSVISFIETSNNMDVQAIISSETGHLLLDALGNVLSSGSLLGPNNSFNITKPDINAPGSNVFAAYADLNNPPPQFAFLSGTSMSAPHVSGSAALLISAHPDWSPSEIKSALMMTAYNTGTKTNGMPTNTDEVGSGTVDLSKASQSGLVMDETFDNYLAANPAQGGSSKTLNIPSLRENNCNENCNWVRTVTNKSGETMTWSTDEYKFTNGSSGAVLQVTPSSFTLNDNESQILTVNLEVCDGNALFEHIFTDIVLTPTNLNTPSSRMTVVVRPNGTMACVLPPVLDVIYLNSFE